MDPSGIHTQVAVRGARDEPSGLIPGINGLLIINYGKLIINKPFIPADSQPMFDPSGDQPLVDCRPAPRMEEEDCGLRVGRA